MTPGGTAVFAAPGPLLAPGLPDDLLRTPDLLVVGGGVAGLAVARQATASGLRTLVIEADRLAGGPTGRAAGGLIPDVHALSQPAPFVALGRRGLALHRWLHDAWGPASTFRAVDCRVSAPVVDAAVVVADQGMVDPLGFAVSLAAEAGQVATGVAATGIEQRGGTVRAVETTAGTITPGAVVVATGLLPPWLAGSVAAAPPPRAVKGHLLATEPAPFAIEQAHVADIVVFQRTDGRLIAGGTFELDDTSPVVRPAVVAAVIAALDRLVPGASQLRVTHTWCCFRPGVADELPIVDRLPGLDNAFVVAGLYRSGLLTAPAVAEAVVAWLLHADRPDAVAAFALDRRPAGTAVTPRARR